MPLSEDDDWPSLILNMAKARTVLRRMSRILSREGASLRVYTFLFKAVVQLVLIFGAETWVVNLLMGRVLGVFQDQVERRLTGQLQRRKLDGNLGVHLGGGGKRRGGI